MPANNRWDLINRLRVKNTLSSTEGIVDNAFCKKSPLVTGK